ncbi:hypothetical protein [Nannocystis punicea]|uniref:Uncharacterized protein n=1 Tax=Nannocystis punicea TaxID=2995304 RepID=A0ABY7HD63_9BACT|nr:hypothetical protein [Nannocystis poenicansa]WAS97230.1 hypothetical protein O0S08_13870 [Nannocystis poenicansa]
MHRSSVALAVALFAACGQGSDSSESSSTTGTTEPTGTSTTTSTATAEPTTTAAVTTSADTTDAGTTTGPAPSCETSAMDCGVDVGEQMSFCPDEEDAVGSLVIDVLGPGQIRLTELGHDAACDLTFSPKVQLLPNNSILVIYDIGGNPMDNCVCKYTISAVLSNLTSGTWTVQVASFMQQVEVP